LSRATLERALPADERLLVDSSALIAHLQGNEPASPAATVVIDDLVRSGRNPCVVSMVTVMEVLVRPLRRSLVAYQHVLDFLAHHPHLRAQPIDLAVAQEAAGIRAAFNLPTPDSLVVATGIVCQVARLVTNDQRWKAALRPLGSRVEVVQLGDHLPW